ncbi:MAG: hypothetical protein KKA65_00605 [Nanoarchaeota archaeon]|nr:hypothetical protein [Nanoarchaeota archaeon]MBU4352381.1 hypothetical protein [Nanoarchaeota archaeon]MBU4455979.1 hypothetical protein [Nanoarchaeota archaeon]MCG2719871.1 hypothetical protein [Nanoarchaeota archaeon]
MKRKGVAWLSWILLFALFISLSVTMIIWAKSKTTDVTQTAMSDSDARMQCSNVKFNVEKNPDCSNVNIENRGWINIKDLDIWADDAEIIGTEKIIVQQTINLNNLGTPNIVAFLPIIEIDGKTASCKEKRLTVEC